MRRTRSRSPTRSWSDWSTGWRRTEPVRPRSPRSTTFLQLRKAAGKRIRGIFIYDENGRWLATTENVDLASFNNSDRDYFQHHKSSPDRGTLIGRPVKSRSGGQWIITASRRFNHPDGSFAGVALTTIDAGYFSKFYEQFDIGQNGAVSLLNADGIMLARSADENGTYVGRDMSSAPLFKSIATRRPVGRVLLHLAAGWPAAAELLQDE